MSNFPSYKTKTFSPSQKFFVLDPNTGSPAFVQGSDLVAQITPNSNYVYAESTRTTAQATDYPLGAVIQTGGATSVGDNLAGVYLVVPSDEGDFPMDNGNELLVLAGDDTLREQLALNTTGNGSDLIAHTGTTDTVTEALDKRTIYVGSVAELEGLQSPSNGDQATLSPDRQLKFSTADLSAKVLSDTKQIFYIAPSGEDGSTGAWVWDGNRKAIPVEWAGGVSGDSSVSAKTANEEALAAIEAFDYQPLFSSGLDYYVSAGYDVWQHRFSAGRNVSLFVGATEYNVSNAFWGIYRIDDFQSGTNNYITLRNARDGIVIARIARGDESGASHVFNLPLDIRRDSHALIAAPGTQGNTNDILFRTYNNSDTFYIVNDPTFDQEELSIVYDTLAANPDGSKKASYAFDKALTFPGNTSRKYIRFPTLIPNAVRGMEFTEEGADFKFPRADGGNRKVGTTRNFAQLPLQEEFFRNVDGTKSFVITGIATYSFVSNTGVFGSKRQQITWTYDNIAGATLSVTDEVDTMPLSVTADIITISGDRVGFSLNFDDTAGDGTDCQISAMVDYSYASVVQS